MNDDDDDYVASARPVVVSVHPAVAVIVVVVTVAALPVADATPPHEIEIETEILVKNVVVCAFLRVAWIWTVLCCRRRMKNDVDSAVDRLTRHCPAYHRVHPCLRHTSYHRTSYHRTYYHHTFYHLMHTHTAYHRHRTIFYHHLTAYPHTCSQSHPHAHPVAVVNCARIHCHRYRRHRR